MMEVLYEKDLRPLKLHILESPRHRRTVREIARRLGVEPKRVMKRLMEQFDMQLLENLPARFEQGLAHLNSRDPIVSALGVELFTEYVPLFTQEEMLKVLESAKERLKQGDTLETAIARALEQLRGVLS